MGRTPDRHDGPTIEDEEILLGDSGVDPSIPGGISYNAGAFRLWDALGVFNPRSGASSVFGEAYTSAVSEAQSDTTLTPFRNKLTLTTPALNAGTYLVLLFCEARTSSANKQMQVRVQIDAVDAALLDVYPPLANLWLPVSGFKPVALAAGVHAVTLDWRSTSAAFTASVRKARLALWRTT